MGCNLIPLRGIYPAKPLKHDIPRHAVCRVVVEAAPAVQLQADSCRLGEPSIRDSGGLWG